LHGFALAHSDTLTHLVGQMGDRPLDTLAREREQVIRVRQVYLFLKYIKIKNLKIKKNCWWGLDDFFKLM
jgi:hypothetical protein